MSNLFVCNVSNRQYSYLAGHVRYSETEAALDTGLNRQKIAAEAMRATHLLSHVQRAEIETHGTKKLAHVER